MRDKETMGVNDKGWRGVEPGTSLEKCRPLLRAPVQSPFLDQRCAIKGELVQGPNH